MYHVAEVSLLVNSSFVLSCLWLHESDSKCLAVNPNSSIFGVVDYCRPYCLFAIHPWTFQSRSFPDFILVFFIFISGSMWSRNGVGRTTGNEANDLLPQAMHLLFCGTVVVYTPKQQQSYIYCVWIFKCLLLVFCILLLLCWYMDNVLIPPVFFFPNKVHIHFLCWKVFSLSLVHACLFVHVCW